MSAQEKIKQAVDGSTIVIFMKGTPVMPQCGFSAATVQVFQRMGVPFATVNVLADPEVREGVKQLTKWPTIPQVFVGGKFIGGCDIVKEMDASGELAKLVAAAGVQPK
jgi:monothiol glutaredoxin